MLYVEDWIKSTLGLNQLNIKIGFFVANNVGKVFLMKIYIHTEVLESPKDRIKKIFQLFISRIFSIYFK